MGVPTSELAHRTMKCTIEALACWNCTQHVFYTVVPDKSGYSHERDNYALFLAMFCLLHSVRHKEYYEKNLYIYIYNQYKYTKNIWNFQLE